MDVVSFYRVQLCLYNKSLSDSGMNLPTFVKVTSMALDRSYQFPNDSDITLNSIDRIISSMAFIYMYMTYIYHIIFDFRFHVM